MTTIELDDIQAELQRRIDRHDNAEMINLCRNGTPVAVIHYVGTLPPPSAALRPVGLARGTFSVDPRFFEPLPDDLMTLFNGEQP